jgi:hypothetical protein
VDHYIILSLLHNFNLYLFFKEVNVCPIKEGKLWECNICIKSWNRKMVEDCKHVWLCFFYIWSTRGEGENSYISLNISCYFFVFTIFFFNKHGCTHITKMWHLGLQKSNDMCNLRLHDYLIQITTS